jgi:hypothetical protein
MRSSRSTAFAPVGIALVCGLLMLGAGALLTTSAQACPEGGGACPCGAACPSEHAGNCGDAAAGGCAGKQEGAAACACPQGEDGNCACGAECGSKHGGECGKAAAGTGEKKAGSCGCGGGAGAATEPAEKAAPCGGAPTEGGGAQRAVIDPVTGQLAVPNKAEAAADAAAAAPAQAQASADAASATARQIAVPGAGVMAPFPNQRASHAVANVDDSGNPQMGCEHAAE